MFKLAILAAVLYVAIAYVLSSVEEAAYQAKAVHCAQNIEAPGCDSFNTAAGPGGDE